MRQEIQSAKLKRYNANSRGNNSGDCVKRAISLAFDLTYGETSKLLINKMKELRQPQWNTIYVVKNLLADLGAEDRISISDQGITLDQFADDHPSGIYLLLVGKKKGETSHAVTVRDGVVWDSWDSRNHYVESYWEIDNSDRKPIRDTDRNYMEGIARDYAIPVIHAELSRYADKKKWSYSDIRTRSAASDYWIVVKCEIVLNKDELIQKDRYYKFDVVLVIEPTWTEPEIIEFVNKVGKQRAYDRMWSVNEQEKKLKEAAEIEKQLGSDDNSSKLDTRYTTQQEDKFIKTLPGWAKPLVIDVRIQEPGKYIDSYMLKMRKLPGDDKHPEIKNFYLQGETASDIRTMLGEYRNDYDIEGIDYCYWDRY